MPMPVLMRRSLVLLTLVTAMLSSACGAEQKAPEPDQEAIKARLQTAFPGITVTNVQPSPVPGLLQVIINGSDQAFVSPDGEYMLIGNLYQMREGGPVNLEEERLESVREAAFQEVKPGDMITFAAAQPKSEVYVFTDVTCGYCRHMHQEIAGYNAAGITVHYLAFPRAGLKSPVARVMENVWCAKDPKAALTEVKLTGEMKEKSSKCPAPVSAQYNLGNRLGVDGTPAVFTAQGKQMGGYLSPADLAKRLGLGGK